MNEGILYNATKITQERARELATELEITLFDESFSAVPNYTLWIDRSWKHHYDLRAQAEKTLCEIADMYIERARAAVKKGNWRKADFLSGVACSADDRRIEPYVIKAAACRANGNTTGEGLMAELAALFLGNDAFSALIEYYMNMPARVA